MEDDDEDFFSDEGFDDLPPSTLLQLEQNAYRATQAQRVQKPSLDDDVIYEGERPLENHVYQNSVVQEPHTRVPGPNNATLELPARLHSGLTNEYGTLDVGELDAEILNDDAASGTALGQPANIPGQFGPLQDNTLVEDGRHGPLPDSMEIVEETYLPEDPYQQSYDETYDILNERLARENERNQQIMEELASAKSVMETKTGEIAIIRANQAKLAENHDRQLTALRKAMAEESAKHKEELEAARAEGKMLATENAFLRQDLAEEARMNGLKAKSKVEDKVPPVTPKKSRILPFRDGFDDDEIIAISPSKSQGGRSKRGTPTVPGKRKRKHSQGSPTPLQLDPQPEPMMEEAPGDTSDDAMIDAEHYEPVSIQSEDRNMGLMKRILNHRRSPNEERDIEVMAQLTFPSEPQQTISSIVLEETSNVHSGNFPVEYGRTIASLWARALKEKFYKPIPMFMSIIRFIFALDMCTSVPDLIEHLVPVLQESGDVNGVPRFKHSPVSRQNLGQIRQTPVSQLHPEVDSTEALSMLYHMACGCLHVERAIKNFWRHIRYDFILMMLNCSQPIKDIILTLNLLSTSIRPGLFGSIHEAEQDQIANENYIVDRVGNLLSEMPQVDEGQDPYTPLEICSMRLEALSLLMALVFNPIDPNDNHGISVIASHPTVLARLIRAMHDELDALYSYSPEQDLHSSLVNGLMRVIYGVIRRHHEPVDLQAKLCRLAGGKQKFLVVLTRLAFSEGPILEAGIDDETVEMAHEMLDDAVNPQEAEALLEAFPSAKRDD
ncbi:hypothetical protein MW887_006842 [Aspergillus wentii]|nr:hypothetical protein MW887_006842 [Aspergillus wentii]